MHEGKVPLKGKIGMKVTRAKPTFWQVLIDWLRRIL